MTWAPDPELDDVWKKVWPDDTTVPALCNGFVNSRADRSSVFQKRDLRWRETEDRGPRTGRGGGRYNPPMDEQPNRRRRQADKDRTLQAAKTRYSGTRTRMDVVADAMARAGGSTTFLVTHVVWFTVWIVMNTGLSGFVAFDPYPFGLLTMIVSLEAICLSIFILMAQSRAAATSELRDEVTLEVSMRVEEEVTKALQLITGLYRRLNLPLSEDPELTRMLQPLDRDEIERELANQITR